MHPLFKNCKCSTSFICTPLTKDCAESTKKFNQFLNDQLLMPLKLIEELKSLTELQLIDIRNV